MRKVLICTVFFFTPGIVILSIVRPFGANAATLRPAGTLSGGVVHIADLFDGAGAAGSLVLGPAPAPGGRISVPASQLAALAHAYGVAWQPASPADTATLTRPAQPVARAALLPPLRAALAASGLAGDYQISLPGFDPPLVDVGAVPRITVEQLDWQPELGRFSAEIAIAVGPAEPTRLRLAGSVEQQALVVVPTRPLFAGAVIGPADITFARVNAHAIAAEIVQAPDQAIGLQLRHSAFPGQPIAVADLQRAAIIHKGDRIMMALAIPGLALAGVGQALEPGGLGDRIAVRNPVSGAMLSAEITGLASVRVDPNAPAALPQVASR